LITAHRRENIGHGLQQIIAAIEQLAGSFPDTSFIWPVHPNPQVSQAVRRNLAGRANVHLVEPLDYAEFVWLMDRATLLISDSGGVQEEAPSLRKPLLVLREVTERPEAIESGIVELVGTDTWRIVTTARDWLTGKRQLPPTRHNPFGSGDAAAQIVRWLGEPLT
jgi:UDP-N-acetylglucosamine 2-epimerase (non-hydrolysing)